MKKICILVCICIVTVSSWGQLLLHEPFNYTPHATNGLHVQSGEVWIRLNTGDSILVESGSLTYAGLPASSGNRVKFDGAGADNYTTFTSQTSGTVYSSFILNVSSLGTLGTTGGYFTGFSDAATTTTFGATVWTRLSSTAGKYNIGIATRTTAAAVSWLPVDLDPGTSYFIVRAYEMIPGAGNDVGKIWLNPTVGGSEPAADAIAAVGTDLASVQKVFLRQDNATNTPFIEIDEIRVGTTWASVTPGGAPSPSLSATPLTSFGNVCINTSAGPNSFTITGTNLLSTDVVVSALTGFTYSTTSGGTYTTSLTIPHGGGAFSQQVFVKFEPTLVQSYNGNIVVGGGGASSINVAAAGAGVNTGPTPITGAVSNINQTFVTAEGSIPDIGCSPLISYGIEYSTTPGFANGSGIQAPASNLSGGNFSRVLSGLSPATTYYYKAYAANNTDTYWGAEQSFTTASPNPTITTTSLTAFGNVCINTSAGPNSFTINGTNLTTADITVGPLNGFSFSTTSGGTYSASLTLSQAGGTYSQNIYVQFLPTLVQSYNGDIPVNGGGISAVVNVTASGAGVNSPPTVATGSSSGITTTGATLAGSISNNGCSAVTAYGIEWSATNGFANGTGTQVASTNISGGNFSSSISGLSPSTTYYYKAYATNSGGTAYGAQQSFTTASPPPPSLTATALTGFGNVCINTSAGPNSFTINGSNLTAANIVVGPFAGYTFSSTAGGTYSATLTLAQPGGTYSQAVFVRFSPTAVQTYNGNIPVAGGGTTGTLNVAVTGSGVNTIPSVTTGAASNIFTHYATLAGNITANGCSNVTAYGIEFSGINGFADGNGTKVTGTNLSGGAFSVTLNNLVQGATYYYKAFATNNGGTAYGAQQSFTVAAVPDAFTIFPVPAAPGTEMRFSIKNITPGYYGLQFINSSGVLVLQHNMNIQADFINQVVAIPGTMARGVYQVRLVKTGGIVAEKTISIH